MSMLKKAGLTLALLAATAAPAMASSCCDASEPEPKKVADWFAPFDDAPDQYVRLFGLVEAPANEGPIDRGLRLGAGAGLIAMTALDPLGLGTAGRIGTGAAGAVLAWTGLTGTCPAYLPFGLSTRQATEKAAE